jgi:hypothetical protein
MLIIWDLLDSRKSFKEDRYKKDAVNSLWEKYNRLQRLQRLKRIKERLCKDIK